MEVVAVDEEGQREEEEAEDGDERGHDAVAQRDGEDQKTVGVARDEIEVACRQQVASLFCAWRV
jgi:hypothetical protein